MRPPSPAGRCRRPRSRCSPRSTCARAARGRPRRRGRPRGSQRAARRHRPRSGDRASLPGAERASSASAFGCSAMTGGRASRPSHAPTSWRGFVQPSAPRRPPRARPPRPRSSRSSSCDLARRDFRGVSSSSGRPTRLRRPPRRAPPRAEPPAQSVGPLRPGCPALPASVRSETSVVPRSNSSR